MRLPTVSDWLGGGTTWGRADQFADTRSLRRLNLLYDRMALVGEGLSALFLVGFVSIGVYLLTTKSFEDVIFWDGTDHVCVYDSKSGVVEYVDGR